MSKLPEKFIIPGGSLQFKEIQRIATEKGIRFDYYFEDTTALINELFKMFKETPDIHAVKHKIPQDGKYITLLRLYCWEYNYDMKVAHKFINENFSKCLINDTMPYLIPKN
jgi:hypothetical protein